MFNHNKAAFEFDVYDTNKKLLRDFCWWADLILRRDVLSNGRGTCTTPKTIASLTPISFGGEFLNLGRDVLCWG